MANQHHSNGGNFTIGKNDESGQTQIQTPAQTIWYLDLKATQVDSNPHHQQYSSSHNNGNDFSIITMEGSSHSGITNDRFVNTNNTNNNNNNSNNCDITIYDLDEVVNDSKSKQQQQQQQQQRQQMKAEDHVKLTFAAPHSIDNWDRKQKMPFSYNHQQHRHQQHHQHQQHHVRTRGVLIKSGGLEPEHEYVQNKRNADVIQSNIADGVGGDEDGGSDSHDDDDDDDDEGDGDNDSLASMETLSDNVSIWIDGEKHWISGVDGNTTCSDLICAVLNYQNVQKNQQQPNNQKQNECKVVTNTVQVKVQNKEEVEDMMIEAEHLQQQQSSININRKYSVSVDNKVDASISDVITTTTNISNNCGNKSKRFVCELTNNSTNQSMPINTKENYRITASCGSSGGISSHGNSNSCRNNVAIAITSRINAATLPPGITAAQLATDYVIVKQYRHCEEYLDGSTKVFDVLPPHDASNKKECELLLRRLAPPPVHVHVGRHNMTPPFSSLMSTDKDSGMGSPVGSTRSAKFRRRKHKSSQWLAQANTLHPNLSRSSANERLMKIILAQDETIQRQLYLLREKERQIAKIEEEKHRKRERELGKNYLLETYLNGLDEAESQPAIAQDDGEEIFIDEPYQRCTKNTPTTITPAVDNNNCIMKVGENEIISKDGKKEKKKKRHKDKKDATSTCQKDDYHKKLLTHTKEICSVTTATVTPTIIRNNNKMAGEKEQGRNHEGGNEATNEGNIEMQIYWWEKVYSVNKQLQKEEELAAKLHAKVRKYQLKRAYQTHREMQLEIDKLDNNLALQCDDIRKVEANLWTSNEMLQKKLTQLERLSQDYLHAEEKENHQQNEQNTSLCDTLKTVNNLEKSSETPNIVLHNLKTPEEKEKLQKLSLKSSLEMQTIKEDKCSVNDPLRPYMTERKTTLVNQQAHIQQTALCTVTQIPLQQQLLPANYSIRHINQNNNTATSCSDNGNNIQPPNNDNNNNYNGMQTTETMEKCHSPVTGSGLLFQQSRYRVVVAPTTELEIIQEPTSNETVLPESREIAAAAPSLFIDKNMLSSLRVQNTKTMKKQMFNSQRQTPTQTQTLTPTYLPKEQQSCLLLPLSTSAAKTTTTSTNTNSPTIATTTATTTNTINAPPIVTQLMPTVAAVTVKQPSLVMNKIDLSQLGTLV